MTPNHADDFTDYHSLEFATRPVEGNSRVAATASFSERVFEIPFWTAREPHRADARLAITEVPPMERVAQAPASGSLRHHLTGPLFNGPTLEKPAIVTCSPTGDRPRAQAFLVPTGTSRLESTAPRRRATSASRTGNPSGSANLIRPIKESDIAATRSPRAAPKSLGSNEPELRG